MKVKQPLGPLERKVLQVLWERKKASVTEVQLQLNLQKEKHLAYTTVMTILTRLVNKDVLIRAKEGRSYYYSPKETKEQFLRNAAKKTLSGYVERFGKEALQAFIDEAKKLS